MASVTLENVTSTILEGSYYETLATTALNTEKIDGETVVTEPNDIFMVVAAQIKIDDLCGIIDSRLINQQDFAIRLHAMSLVLNKKTTNKQFYEALLEHDCHPAFVSVLTEVGKEALVDTMDILRSCVDDDDYDEGLCRAASENKLKVMEILKEFGATNYNRALAWAAGKGRVEAMELLRDWKADCFNWALEKAAEGGHLKAMELLEKWGARDFNAALESATMENHLKAMELLYGWGADKFEWPLVYAVMKGSSEAVNLCLKWGAKDYDDALGHAAMGGYAELIQLFLDLGATDYNGALCSAALAGRVETMKIFLELGATNYEAAFREASKAAYDGKKAQNLLRQWMRAAR